MPSFAMNPERDGGIGHGPHGPHGAGGRDRGRGPRRGRGGFGPGGAGGFGPGPEGGFGGPGPGDQGPGGHGFGGPGFGPGWEGGPGWGRGPGWGGPGPSDWAPWRAGRRMRRGDIRIGLLAALLDGPAHGYELIRRLEERSGGLWRPSAGSVYPTLQLLQEEGLLTSRDEDGKRTYALTDEGRVAAEQARQRGPAGPGESNSHRQLRHSLRTLLLAFRQVAEAGDAAQAAAAVDILDEARRRLYRLLAGDTPASSAGAGAGGEPPTGEAQGGSGA